MLKQRWRINHAVSKFHLSEKSWCSSFNYLFTFLSLISFSFFLSQLGHTRWIPRGLGGVSSAQATNEFIRRHGAYSFAIPRGSIDVPPYFPLSPVHLHSRCPSKDGRFARCYVATCELCHTSLCVCVCVCVCVCACVCEAKDAHRRCLAETSRWLSFACREDRAGGEKTGRGSYDTWTRSVAIHWPNMQRVMPFYVALQARFTFGQKTLPPYYSSVFDSK